MASDRSRVPFWAHQAVEYLLAVGIALGGVGLGASASIALGGAAAVGALAAFSDGPLGAWPVLPRHRHRHADFVVVVALAAGPLVLRRTAPALLIVLGLAAASLAALSRATDFSGPRVRNHWARALGRVVGRRQS